MGTTADRTPEGLETHELSRTEKEPSMRPMSPQEIEAEIDDTYKQEELFRLSGNVGMVAWYQLKRIQLFELRRNMHTGFRMQGPHEG